MKLLVANEFGSQSWFVDISVRFGWSPSLSIQLVSTCANFFFSSRFTQFARPGLFSPTTGRRDRGNAQNTKEPSSEYERRLGKVQESV